MRDDGQLCEGALPGAERDTVEKYGDSVFEKNNEKNNEKNEKNNNKNNKKDKQKK